MGIRVNGRFEGQRITGVQRYARELTSRFAGKLAVVTPEDAIGGVRGHLWEQCVLPRRIKGSLLWSPCNTGPLSVRNQVVTIHDCGFLDESNGFTWMFANWYRWLVPRLARRARRIITVSEFSRQRLLEHTGLAPERVVAIPNGVSDQFTPQDPQVIDETKRRLGLPEQYVLAVGSLQPRKNLARLLEAWRQLPVQDWNLSLVLAGATGQQFRSIQLAGDVPSVIAAGYVDDSDLAAVYSGASMFVFPSLYEGFGLPVLEAMACGTPVVCSNATALPEVVGDAGILVDPYDPQAIAAGIRQMWEDPALRETLKERGPRIAERFTWERTAAATWQVLAAAAENN